MKKYKYYIASIVASVALLQACTKLDSKVYDQVPVGNFYQTPDQVSAVIASVYNPMTNLPFGATFDLNEVSTDECIVPTRGNDWLDGDKWQNMWKHNFLASIDDVNNSWNDLNSGVTKCNFVISIINGLTTKPANSAAVIAEIKVLRAFYLFKFMDLYGNIPLVTDYNTDPSKVKQSTRAQVYAFIESELTTNVPLLSTAKDATTYGHMNQWGGYMLMAKLYLNAQVYTGSPEWAKAQTAADMVIKSGVYSLQPNFLDNFIVINDNSVENIFVVPYDAVYIAGNGMQTMTLNYNNQYTYDLTAQPNNGFCSPTPFYRSFTTTDARQKMWITGQQYSSAGAVLIDPATSLHVILSPYVNELSNPADSFKFAGARSVKYAPQPGTYGQTSNDGVIFRLGDAYLMRAEAEFRQGNTVGALADVNMVRQRAGVPLWTTMTSADLLAERGREMAWEEWRRNDLIRFEVADGVPYFTGARNPGKSADGNQHTFLMPIPDPQHLTNTNLVQNPGYAFDN